MVFFLYFCDAGGSQNKFIYFIHSTEYPRTTFTVVDPPYVCLVADNTLDTIFTHLKQSYVPRKQLKVEAKGLRYEVRGKYIVKFGSVTFSNTSKSIIVEVSDNNYDNNNDNNNGMIVLILISQTFYLA